MEGGRRLCDQLAKPSCDHTPETRQPEVRGGERVGRGWKSQERRAFWMCT